MKKIFYCILPFIVIWGGYFSLLFVPQLHYEYLGTVNSDIVVTTSEHRCGNDYYYLFNYKFTYEDEMGITRSSEKISSNEVFEYIPSQGFNSRSNKSWIVKQLLKNGKVYAPGWKSSSILNLIILGGLLFVYFLVHGVDHLSCYLRDNNYHCGYSRSDCFGCPFCVTDKQTTFKIRTIFIKFIESMKNIFVNIIKNVKQFFGYG